VELDAPGAVAQPERMVAIELISGKPAHGGGCSTHC